MSRSAARGLHLALILVGLGLYLVFVLPRWWVLTGDIPTGLATAGRLAAGLPIALAALPVFAILRDALARTAKTPELALRLRAWSAVLHIVAGGLILLAAIVEIWLRLGVGGPYLFAVYGAAGSIAILAVLALYLSFVAEKPPAEPKPPKPPKPKKLKTAKVKAEKVKAEKKPNTADTSSDDVDEVDLDVGIDGDEVEVAVDEIDGDETDGDEADVDVTEADVTEADVTEADVTEADVTETVETADHDSVVTEAEATSTGLRNKRPAGKRFRRLGR